MEIEQRKAHPKGERANGKHHQCGCVHVHLPNKSRKRMQWMLWMHWPDWTDGRAKAKTKQQKSAGPSIYTETEMHYSQVS